MPIRNRRGKWHYRFYVNGEEYTGATDLDATERNRTAAMRKEAEARSLVLEGKERLLKLEVRSFNEAAKLFLEWADGHYREHPNSALRIRTSFASLLVFFGRTPMTSITAGHIDDFTSWRRREHEVRDVTIRHDLHALSVFMQYAQRHNWVRDNPVRESEIPSDAEAVRIHPLTLDEERRYFETALSQFTITAKGRKTTHGPFQALHDLGRLMLNQGCRPEELLNLAKRHVNLRERTFRIVSGKSKAAKRTLSMTDESEMIFARRMRTPGPWVFPGKDESEAATKLNGPHSYVLRAIGGAFVIYDFRHTFATRMATAGMPIPQLAAILGHGDLRSVAKYIHPSEEDTRIAMRKYESAVSLRSGFGPVEIAKEGEKAGTIGNDREGLKIQ